VSAEVVPPAASSYDSIDSVPEVVLREALCRALHTFGATVIDDLIQAVARQLGFRRTGSRIRDRIEECLEGLIRVGEICRTADQRVQPSPTSRAANM
jgi:hypothetical protein